MIKQLTYKGNAKELDEFCHLITSHTNLKKLQVELLNYDFQNKLDITNLINSISKNLQILKLSFSCQILITMNQFIFEDLNLKELYLSNVTIEKIRIINNSIKEYNVHKIECHLVYGIFELFGDSFKYLSNAKKLQEISLISTDFFEGRDGAIKTLTNNKNPFILRIDNMLFAFTCENTV